MSSTPPLAVFLVDPNRPRRDLLERELQHRFRVFGFGSVMDAAAAAVEAGPRAAVFSLRQIEEHGLKAAAAFRKLVGPGVFLAVIGEPETPLRPEMRAELISRHGVDWWRGQGVEPQAIDTLLWNELVHTAPRSVPPSVAPRPRGGLEWLRSLAAGLRASA